MWVRPDGKSLVFQTLGDGGAPVCGTADLDGDAFVLRWTDDDSARHELRAEAAGEDRLRLVRRRTAGGDGDTGAEPEELWARTSERRGDG